MSKRLVGKKIADRYSLVEKIGEGGMGVVWKAMSFADPSVYYAIKVIQANAGKNIDSQVVALQKEAATISRLAHPLIVDFIEIGKAPDFLGANSYYIVMELAKGVTLKNLLLRDKKRDAPFAIQLGLQIADVLDYTHSKGIVHRDIKPQNIMVNRVWKDASGVQFKVLDFGISRAIENTHFTGENTARSYEVAGTPLYMAPEQAYSVGVNADHRADLYSLGCVLYEVLTGAPPFQSSSKAEIRSMHATELPKPIEDLEPTVPLDVCRIIAKLLSKNPEERYTTAFSLKSDLITALRRNRQGKVECVFKLGQKDSVSANHISLPIIGREYELDLVEKSYRNFSEGMRENQVFILRGDTGVGKRKIAYQTRKLFSAKGRRYLTIQFSKYESHLPLHSLCNSLSDFIQTAIRGEGGLSGETREKLSTLKSEELTPLFDKMPILRSLFDKSAELYALSSDYSPFQERKALVKLFECLLSSSEKPSLFMHDIQWADKHSLGVVLDVLHSKAVGSIFMMIVEQETFGAVTNDYTKFIRSVDSGAKVVPLSIKNLNRCNAKSLVQTLLRDEVVNLNDVFESLFEQTRGSPLLLLEVLKNHLVKGNLKRGQGGWLFDSAAVHSGKLAYESSETSVRSIRTLSTGERNLLDVASILGEVFSIEDLFFDKHLSVKEMAEHLRSLEQKKLIQKLKHRSANGSNAPIFSFVHKNARRAVYSLIRTERRVELHKFVASLLYSRQKRGMDVSVYRIAHHYNLGVGADKNGSELREQSRFVKTNLKAAEEAMVNESWQTASQYLLFIIDYHAKWVLSFLKPSEVDGMVESVGDLYIIQNKYKLGLVQYNNIMSRSKSLKDSKRVLSKLVYVHNLMGRSSDALKAYRKFTQRCFPEKNRNFLAKVKRMASRNIVDSFKLGKKFLTNRFRQVGGKQSRGDLLLLHRALDLPLPWVEKKVLLDLGAEKISDLNQSQIGFIRFYCRAGSLFPTSHRKKIIGHIRHPIAEFCSLQFGKLKFGSNLYIKKLATLKNTVDSVWDRDVWLEMHFQNLLNAWLDLDDEAMESALKRLPETIPTRNWFTPVFMSMVLSRDFALGKKNRLIKRSAFFLDRRRKVGARSDGLPELQIRCLKELAEGANRDALSTFSLICKRLKKTGSYIKTAKNNTSNAWNACFLVSAASFLEAETHGFSVKSPLFVEFAGALKSLCLELKGTSFDVLGEAVSGVFSNTGLKVGSPAFPAIALLRSSWEWTFKKIKPSELFGKQSQDAIEKMPALFERFFATEDSVETAHGLHKKSFASIDISKIFMSNNSKSKKVGLFADALISTGFAGKIVLLNPLLGERKNGLYLAGGGECVELQLGVLEKYLSSYEKIKKSFFIPATDQPWVQSKDDLGETDFAGDNAFQERETLVLAAPDGAPTDFGKGASSLEQPATEMNAIIPVNAGEGKGCILFLQGVDLRGDTFELREVYGVISSVMNSFLTQDSTIPFAQGKIALEECNWLDIWSQGALRKDREASFYLGLNFGPNHYVLAYCSIQGTENFQSFFAQALWQQMVRFRLNSEKLDHNELRLRDLSSELNTSIHNLVQPGRLSSLAFVLSVFDRRSSQVYSAQWGSTRPLVLGSQNYIKSGEGGALQTRSGKVRFFEMNAALIENGAYILALKLMDKIPKTVRESAMSQKGVMATCKLETPSSGFKQIVQEFWNTSGYKPRYFVAVSLKRDGKAIVDGPRLDQPA